MGDYAVLAARITAGLLAGLYFTFAVAVMPALRGLHEEAFVETMRRINVSIVNPAFLLVFLAAPVLAVVAALVVRSTVMYGAAALGVATLVVTVMINVPLNNHLAANGSRAAFEHRWGLSNVVRTLTGIGSFVCLLLARTTVH